MEILAHDSHLTLGTEACSNAEFTRVALSQTRELLADEEAKIDRAPK